MSHRDLRTKFAPTLAIGVCLLASSTESQLANAQENGDIPGWTLLWEDDFSEFDADRWTKIDTNVPTNNSLQDYLPEQVTVENGMLVLTSEDVPSRGLPYRSGQVISKAEQLHGRWEVRAKLPATTGMWPAIWLLPDVTKHRWPSGGEIDIMENRGNQPKLTSSAFHYGTNPPYAHHFVFDEQQTSVGGALVNYHSSFHTYAVDWTESALRFYVDGVHYHTVHDEDVDGFLSQSVKPMQIVINTAVGGEFLPNPDSSTAWPQRFEIDWVKVYEAHPESRSSQLANGSFEDAGGTLSGWTVFGDELHDNPNILAADEAVREGGASLKMFGTFGTGNAYSGVTQSLAIEPGQQMRLSLANYVRSLDSIAGTDNTVTMKIEFYAEFGAKFGTDAMLEVEELQIANGSTAADVWHQHSLTATAPAGAEEARVAIVFHQPGLGAGAVHVDQVTVTVVDSATSMGDFNQDGIVSLADYTVWRDTLGASGSHLVADGDLSGKVDEGDYLIWKQNLGQVSPSAGFSIRTVPEAPAAFISWASAAVAYLHRCVLK